MDPVKISHVAKKSLKVAVNDIVKSPTIELPEESVAAPIDEIIDANIQASKPIKLTKKGKPDTRGNNLDNLAKGRAKLQESWVTKRKMKEDYAAAALQKKLNLAAKQKKVIEQAFGVDGVSSDDEAEAKEVGIVEDLKKKQILKKSPPVDAPVAAPQAKAPKKKVIKYVEVDSSSEEEEEIVYVKKQKKPTVSRQKNSYVDDEPKKAVSPFPQIVFY